MKRILITDDSSGWRKYHAQALGSLFPDMFEMDFAASATEANSKLYENADTPYDIILTDMQMENDYAPLYAGEWLIEQIQSMKSYFKTRIIIISATPSIKLIAQKYNVDYLPKYNCRDINSYKIFVNQK